MEDLQWTGPTKAAEGMHPELKELAERLTKWPSNAYWAACLEGREGMQCYGWPENLKPNCYTVFTYHQWLQARKDLGLDKFITPEEERMYSEIEPMTPDEEEMDVPEWAGSVPEGVIGGKRTAENFLHEAANLMTERGKQYDQPDGERSMGKTIAAFNTITGRDLTEAEGWLIQTILKRVRQYSRPVYHKDSAEDAVAYAALEAEALEASGE